MLAQTETLIIVPGLQECLPIMRCAEELAVVLAIVVESVQMNEADWLIE